MFPLRIKDCCRELRKNQTRSEVVLWEAIRDRNLSGYKIRRQHPFIYRKIEDKVDFFIADFYFPKSKLIVELDGKIHDYQKDYDNNRDAILSTLGLKTLRIKNEEIDKDLEGVLQKIMHAIQTSFRLIR